MFGIGGEEFVLIFLIALLVLGPDRMPKIARDLGRMVNDLRRASDELREEFLNSDRAASAPAATTPAITAGEPAPAGPPDENAFDREMREARERLKGL